ncbi:MAG: capsule biosynthesis protein [Paracoccaceae bacterium]
MNSAAVKNGPHTDATVTPFPSGASAPVSWAFLRTGHWIIIASFVICVLAPIAIAGGYLHWRAADQFVSRVGFAVRSENGGTPSNFLGIMTFFSASSSSDTDILFQYIKSQDLVSSVDQALDIRTRWALPKDDRVFRFSEGGTIEDLVAYWAKMVRVTYDPGTGLIEVEVRAFAPEDAQAVAQEILGRSGELINKMSAVSRQDATVFAETQLIEAVGRLKAARQALTLFRNETQIVDPGVDLHGQMGLLNSLQVKLADTLIKLDMLHQTARPNDPRTSQAKREVAAIQNRIAQERQKLGVSANSGDAAYAYLVGQYESLIVDLEFAEGAYVSSLTAYDAAVAQARRKSRYLAAYLNPTFPESPEHPQRGIILILLALGLFGVWAIGAMVFYSLKDRR